MRTREADGSWHLRSRAFGFQPFFESEFPYARDQFISRAATAHSAMALMLRRLARLSSAGSNSRDCAGRAEKRYVNHQCACEESFWLFRAAGVSPWRSRIARP